MSRCLLVVLLSLGWLCAQAETGARLTLTQRIVLRGVSGALDALAVDASRPRLYVTAPANQTVEVLDLAAGKRLRPYRVKDARDVLLLSKPNLLYVSSGAEGQVKVIDCAAGRAIKTLGHLPDADRLGLDGPANRIYLGYGAGALALINAQTGVHTLSIMLSGHPAAFVIERVGGRIFVNLPTVNQVAVIDRLSRELITQWSLDGFGANHALALDETRHRLFVGCRRPPRLVALDTQSGQRVAEVPIAGEVNTLCFDPKRRWVYVVSGEGEIAVVAPGEADQYEVQTRIAAVPGTRAAALTEDGETLFVAVPGRGNTPAEVRGYRLGP